MPVDARDGRVLVLAPTGRDALLLCESLERDRLPTCVCRDMSELVEEITAGAGAAVITEEALGPDGYALLRQAIGEQPAWSDMPIIVLMSSRSPHRERAALGQLASLGNVTVLIRPIGTTAFGSAVSVALRGRRRQYEIRKHVEDLQASSRAKDEFVAMLAHELRNPLASMRNAIEILGRSDARPEQLRDSHDVLERQLHRLARLLDDLLDASRVAQRKIRLSPRVIDLRICVDECLANFRPAFEKAHLRLFRELADEPIVVEVDPDRMVQVIDNLLSNALKYTPPGGQVTVGLVRAGNEALLSIADTGVGLARKDLQRIFELFEQVDPSIDRAAGGLGVGLTIVRGLVELHGGRIAAASNGPGQGSQLTVILPLAAGVAESVPPEVAVPPGPRRRILVVEDNPDAREMLRVLLELDGHSVRTAADGFKALDLAREEKPDVVMVDVGLPGLDGYEVGRRLRGQFGNAIRLIAVTGYGQPESRETAANVGFDTFLVKPVEPRALALALVPPLGE